MSKRNTHRSQPRAERKKRGKRPQDGHRTAGRSRQSGWLKTCLWAALGLMLGAVVALQLASRTSMISAMMRLEHQRLTRSPGQSSRLLNDDVSVWEQFRLGLASSLSEDEDAQQHNALASLMTALVTERERSTGDETAAARTDRLLQVDHDNLVARLAVGTLRDRSGPSGRSPSATGLERFARLRGIVEQAPGYRHSTLHRQAYFGIWDIALGQFVRRRDVRLSLSRSMPEQFDAGIGYGNTYEGLLKISTTLAALADTLRMAGQLEEAMTCDLWVAQMALGIIENETDVAVQRLCTRLLVDRLGADSEVVHDLRTMIQDLDQRREATPRDLTGQSFRSAFGEPALDPEKYRWALVSLIIVLVFVLTALGAVVVLVLAIVGAVLSRLIRRKPRSETEERFVPAYATALMLFIPAVGTSALVLRTVMVSDLYCSAVGGLVELCTAVAAGSLGILTIAGFRARPKSPVAPPSRRSISGRNAIVLGLALLPLALLAIAPSTVALACQQLDMFTSSVIVALVGSCALVLIGLFVSPARLRTIAATAALGMCINMAAALAVMPFHRTADYLHIRTVLDARGDEFSARLGKDWQKKYLQSTRRILQGFRP